MLNQDTECHIVNTSSISGLLSSSLIAPYSVSKHGVVILSEALYQEFQRRDRKIGISVLCPGTITTKILEAERNRPIELQNKSGEGVDITNPEVQSVIRHLSKSTEDGMAPEKVAEIVFNAIKEKSFYIFANINQEKSIIRSRLEDILQERNPSIGW